MTTNYNGSGPGQVTPENDAGIVTGQGDNPQKTTNYASKFTAETIAIVNNVDFPRYWVFALLLLSVALLLGACYE